LGEGACSEKEAESMCTIREAKKQLESLIKQVQHGGEILISRGGLPIAKLVGIAPEQAVRNKHRTPGRYKGMLEIHPSFYDFMDEGELREWGIE
jgi:prevent-host-death family protein